MRHPLIDQMFDSAQFSSTGHALIDILTQYLQTSLTGSQALMNWRGPKIADQDWQQKLPEQPTLDAASLLQLLQQDILPHGLAIHHPHNLGHQVATPLPLAALCDLVASLTNQAMAVYETGPAATLIERQVIRWLTSLIGWDSTQADGVLTSGGAQANLTALLAARQHCAGWNVWQQGHQGQKRLCLLASEHAHYSVMRAAGIMGLGTDAVVSVACDAQGRMSIASLQQAYAKCMAAGATIIAVVASAGCTPTGSIDPLRAIAEFCQTHQLWLHVDGAHGASALLSEQQRGLLDGIELADSVVWDGHKLLYMPATVSAVLFRRGQDSYAAFAQDASYLFQDNAHEAQAFNTSYRTLECTKRMMGLKLWAAFSLYGTQGLGLLVDHAFANARDMAQQIKAHAEFELLMPPATNIVCFRHRPADIEGAALSQHQTRLRLSLVESGAFHLTQVQLDGAIWLRCTLMNPYTEASHIASLLQALAQADLAAS